MTNLAVLDGFTIKKALPLIAAFPAIVTFRIVMAELEKVQSAPPDESAKSGSVK